MNRIRRRKGGALAPLPTSPNIDDLAYRRKPDVRDGASAPPLCLRIRLTQAKPLHTVPIPSTVSLMAGPGHTAMPRGDQTSMSHAPRRAGQTRRSRPHSWSKALAGQASPPSTFCSSDPVAREPASSTSIAQSDHPHGPTSASSAEVNNTSRTRVLHTRYWLYSVGRFTKAITCMQRFATCEQKSSVMCILRPWRGAACSHDHEVFNAGSFMLAQLG